MQNNTSSITIHEVTTHSQRRAFLALPEMIYRDSSVWIHPLNSSIRAIFSRSRNPFFTHGDAARFIATEDKTGRCIGRIAVFHGKKVRNGDLFVGGCGFFECVNSPLVSQALFNAARQWLTLRGFNAMDGPINFGPRDAWWGLLVEGFEHAPLYENNYNPPYYQTLFERYGFRNYYDQITYHLPPDTLYGESPTAARAARLLRSTEGTDDQYLVRSITRREIDLAARHFCTIYNAAWQHFDSFTPLAEQECLRLFRKMRPIVDPQLIRFVFHRGEAVAFSIMVPDINPLLKDFKGHMGLFEKLLLLLRLRLLRSATRLFGVVFGVLPSYQGRGVESLLIESLRSEHAEGLLCGRYSSLEFAWVGDFNPVMQRMMEQYVGALPLKVHTTYRLLFDSHHPFIRCPRLSLQRKSNAR